MIMRPGPWHTMASQHPPTRQPANGNRQEATAKWQVATTFAFIAVKRGLPHPVAASSQQPLNGNCCQQHLHCDASNEILSAAAAAACATFVSASCAFWSGRGPKKKGEAHSWPCHSSAAPVCRLCCPCIWLLFLAQQHNVPRARLDVCIYIYLWQWDDDGSTQSASSCRCCMCTMLWHWHWQKCGNSQPGSQPAFICTSCCSCCSCIFGKCGHAAYT